MFINDEPSRLTVYAGVDDGVAWHVKQLCMYEASMGTSDQPSVTRNGRLSRRYEVRIARSKHQHHSMTPAQAISRFTEV